MKNLAVALLTITAVTLSSAPALAQSPAPVRAGSLGPSQVERRRPNGSPLAAADVFELVLRDGSRVFGSVERESDVEIVFRTNTGSTLTARRADVVSLRRVKGRISKGEFRRSDEHRSRLFFAPTARSLEKGQVSVGVFEFLAPFVQAGVTDRLSVGGGTPLLFGFNEGNRPFWLTPKLQVYNGAAAQAAVGVLHVFDFDGHNAGIAYAVTTFGSVDNAITAGAGMGYAGDSRGAIMMVGGERRVRRNLKLITENYLWDGGCTGFLSGGVRFIGERLSADLGLAVPIGMGEMFAFPVVNFVYVF